MTSRERAYYEKIAAQSPYPVTAQQLMDHAERKKSEKELDMKFFTAIADRGVYTVRIRAHARNKEERRQRERESQNIFFKSWEAFRKKITRGLRCPTTLKR